ncbi:zinc finger protein 809-like [Ostrinia furnacalis]|uniref:zinc finger protein 809-like n=1 Tax=Ostrinia furnacalis TaxID=93504 RepID=UPI00103CB5DC|nr:zinc finger protein 809-like [Ostrinia furnacalis]
MHLRAHEEELTPTLVLVCAACRRAFRGQSDAQELPQVTRINIKPFQCHICLKQLTRRSRLHMHLRAHEEELTPTLVLVCAACRRAFRGQSDAQEHVTNSPECMEGFVKELKQEADEATAQLSPTSGLVKVIESPPPPAVVPRQVSNALAAPLLTGLTDEARSVMRVVEIEKAFRCEYCEE